MTPMWFSCSRLTGKMKSHLVTPPPSITHTHSPSTLICNMSEFLKRSAHTAQSHVGMLFWSGGRAKRARFTYTLSGDESVWRLSLGWKHAHVMWCVSPVSPWFPALSCLQARPSFPLLPVCLVFYIVSSAPAFPVWAIPPVLTFLPHFLDFEVLSILHLCLSSSEFCLPGFWLCTE